MSALILTALISGILLLDNTYAGQFLLSEPIFMLPLLSVFKGDFKSAVQAGLNIEFLFLGRLAVGASIPPFAGFAAAVFWSAAVYGNDFSAGRMVALFILAVPAGYWGRDIDIFIRKLNGYYSEYRFEVAGQKLKKSKFSGISAGVALSLLFIFLLNSVNIFILGIAVHHGGALLMGLSGDVFSPAHMQWIWRLFPLTGVLFLLDRFNDKRNNGYFILGIIAGIAAGVIFWTVC